MTKIRLLKGNLQKKSVQNTLKNKGIKVAIAGALVGTMSVTMMGCTKKDETAEETKPAVEEKVQEEKVEEETKVEEKKEETKKEEEKKEETKQEETTQESNNSTTSNPVAEDYYVNNSTSSQQTVTPSSQPIVEGTVTVDRPAPRIGVTRIGGQSVPIVNPTVKKEEAKPVAQQPKVEQPKIEKEQPKVEQPKVEEPVKPSEPSQPVVEKKEEVEREFYHVGIDNDIPQEYFDNIKKMVEEVLVAEGVKVVQEEFDLNKSFHFLTATMWKDFTKEDLPDIAEAISTTKDREISVFVDVYGTRYHENELGIRLLMNDKKSQVEEPVVTPVKEVDEKGYAKDGYLKGNQITVGHLRRAEQKYKDTLVEKGYVLDESVAGGAYSETLVLPTHEDNGENVNEIVLVEDILKVYQAEAFTVSINRKGDVEDGQMNLVVHFKPSQVDADGDGYLDLLNVESVYTQEELDELTKKYRDVLTVRGYQTIDHVDARKQVGQLTFKRNQDNGQKDSEYTDIINVMTSADAKDFSIKLENGDNGTLKFLVFGDSKEEEPVVMRQFYLKHDEIPENYVADAKAKIVEKLESLGYVDLGEDLAEGEKLMTTSLMYHDFGDVESDFDKVIGLLEGYQGKNIKVDVNIDGITGGYLEILVYVEREKFTHDTVTNEYLQNVKKLVEEHLTTKGATISEEAVVSERDPYTYYSVMWKDLNDEDLDKIFYHLDSYKDETIYVSIDPVGSFTYEDQMKIYVHFADKEVKEEPVVEERAFYTVDEMPENYTLEVIERFGQALTKEGYTIIDFAEATNYEYVTMTMYHDLGAKDEDVQQVVDVIKNLGVTEINVSTNRKAMGDDTKLRVQIGYKVEKEEPVVSEREVYENNSAPSSYADEVLKKLSDKLTEKGYGTITEEETTRYDYFDFVMYKDLGKEEDFAELLAYLEEREVDNVHLKAHREQIGEEFKLRITVSYFKGTAPLLSGSDHVYLGLGQEATLESLGFNVNSDDPSSLVTEIVAPEFNNQVEGSYQAKILVKDQYGEDSRDVTIHVGDLSDLLENKKEFSDPITAKVKESVVAVRAGDSSVTALTEDSKLQAVADTYAQSMFKYNLFNHDDGNRDVENLLRVVGAPYTSYETIVYHDDSEDVNKRAEWIVDNVDDHVDSIQYSGYDSYAVGSFTYGGHTYSVVVLTDTEGTEDRVAIGEEVEGEGPDIVSEDYVFIQKGEVLTEGKLSLVFWEDDREGLNYVIDKEKLDINTPGVYDVVITASNVNGTSKKTVKVEVFDEDFSTLVSDNEPETQEVTKQFLAYVNQLRKEKGYGELTVDQSLADVSYKYNIELFADWEVGSYSGYGRVEDMLVDVGYNESNSNYGNFSGDVGTIGAMVESLKDDFHTMITTQETMLDPKYDKVGVYTFMRGGYLCTAFVVGDSDNSGSQTTAVEEQPAEVQNAPVIEEEKVQPAEQPTEVQNAPVVVVEDVKVVEEDSLDDLDAQVEEEIVKEETVEEEIVEEENVEENVQEDSLDDLN